MRKLALATRAVTTIAGKPCVQGTADGTGQTARFNGPTGAVTSTNGSFALIADRDSRMIRKVIIATWGEPTASA